MHERSGRDAGFERLYEEHREAVRGYCLRRADASVADDVVSQTFEIAWRRRDEVRRPSRAWLIGIARKVLANRRRSDRRHLDLVARLGAEPRPGAEEERPPILAALGRLSAGDQEALLLAAWDGLTSSEAAGALGCSPVAFRLRLLRARRRLANELGDLERRSTVTYDHDGSAVRVGETRS